MSTCELSTENDTVLIPQSAWRMAGFRRWMTDNGGPPRGRFSLLGNELLIDMSPEELGNHNQVKTEIARVLANLEQKLKLGIVFSDGSLLTNIDADLSTEPDAMFVSDENLRSKRSRLTPRKDSVGEYTELVGAPDMVLEVVSKSSVRKDTSLLLDRYHRAGIAEYWLVQVDESRIDFRILMREEDGYAPAAEKSGWQRSLVFNRSFRLTRKRRAFDLWRYTLKVKA